VKARYLRVIISSAVATAAALLVSAAVFAHGTETFFVAEPTQVAPGTGVAVRADLLTSGPVRLSLAGEDGSVRELGVVEETDEGHFEAVFQVPLDLPLGEWTLVAEADGIAIASTTIEVAGTLVEADLSGVEERDEEDPLLVPLPSGWQASRSGPPAATPPAVAGTRGGSVDIVPFLGLGAAILALVVLVARTRPRGASGGPSDPSR
jgi:hypothetical protein